MRDPFGLAGNNFIYFCIYVQQCDTSIWIRTQDSQNPSQMLRPRGFIDYVAPQKGQKLFLHLSPVSFEVF